MKKYLVFILLILLSISATATVVADNGISVVKPAALAGQYGTGNGQIDTPVSVKVDADDNIYILQRVHVNEVKYKSVITVYDKNLTLVRSFDVLKKSMVDVGWDRAPGGFYYDNLASAFDIDGNGTLYVLCGWDVVVYDRKGKYQYQFPVSSFMGWIDSTGGDTQFYYPHGLAIASDGYVVITSGSTAKKHEIIFMYPDGKLFMKLETPLEDMADIVRDRSGRLYIIEKGSKILHYYDPTMTKENDISLYFNGTYNGDPASLAFFTDGNFSASANGIFIYDMNGSMRAHFMDNNRSENNKSWNRPMAANSTDWLFVVSGMSDRAKTSRPILAYRYDDGEVPGEAPEFDVCGSIFGMFGGAAALYFFMRRF